ncbi:head GIN domain-containing protein [Cellulomonas cellasea]|uniref:Putative auto-transporter adhesin head GIN domain-containing protein n=1 Tax=Cellulomonas cellasea TaxID=43670 RepID=A0A7W4UF44_9CELL|nr:head GIN domain-containing protein [Cellulomonas cellasea]MBB2923052.1 hypothetical protein [Cellulomonas cellasea]
MSLRPVLAVASAGALLLLTGCGAAAFGPERTEERPADGVTAVELATSGTLVVEQGDEPSLTVTAGRNVLAQLTSEVRDGVLVLDHDDRPGWSRTGKVEYLLVVDRLDAVRVEGSGQVRVDDGVAAGDELTILVEGSGDVRVEGIDVEEVVASNQGSGSIALAGTAERQSVTLDGSGGYDATDLRTREAAVAVEGSGGAQVDVTGTLEASVSGSGSVTHTGGARVTSDVDGSGSVREGS